MWKNKIGNDEITTLTRLRVTLPIAKGAHIEMKRKACKDSSEDLPKSIKNHACYLLITCDEPSADGNMQVQMTCEGDVALASYLLQGAQSLIDDQLEESI